MNAELSTAFQQVLDAVPEQARRRDIPSLFDRTIREFSGNAAPAFAAIVLRPDIHTRFVNACARQARTVDERFHLLHTCIGTDVHEMPGQAAPCYFFRSSDILTRYLNGLVPESMLPAGTTCEPTRP